MTGGVDPQEFGMYKARTDHNDASIKALTTSIKELVDEMHQWRATFKIGKALGSMVVFLALFAGAGMKDAFSWLLKVVP